MRKVLVLLLTAAMLFPMMTAQAEDTARAPQLNLARPDYLQEFADAAYSDEDLIPYPDGRDADGYLMEGEFLYEDPKQGLWAYLSPTVQVQIIQYDMTKKPLQRFFITDVRFKPDQEQFKQHKYVNAQFKDQQIWPKTLAQTSKMVIAINGDYYPYRIERKQVRGNIIRNREILFTMDPNKSMGFPNLDTMALHDDGSLSVYGVHEITAEELLAKGDVHDALSFGPYLIRDGVLRDYDGKNTNQREPRTAIGMVEPGHYIILTAEGRVPNGPKGLTIPETARLLYAYGCEQGFMLDGGSTSVLIFVGEKLNRNGFDKYVGSPRNQHELFGVGTTDLVHTDYVNGKPKK